MGGECSNTPRVTNSIKRCPQDTPTLNAATKYYTSTTEFNCGIDLHARQMYVCVMDRQGQKTGPLYVKGHDFNQFLTLHQPFKHDLYPCYGCTFRWAWVAGA